MSVAAAILIRERRLVGQFQAAGATNPASAQPLEAIGVSEGRALRRLQRQAVVREAKPGRYYIDELSLTALRSTRRRLAAVMLGMLTVGIGLAIAFGLLR